MGKTQTSKSSKNSKNSKTQKAEKILRIVGYVLYGLMFVAEAVLMAFTAKLRVFPIKYLLLAAFLMALVTVLFVFAERNRIAGIITKVLSIVLIVFMIVGIGYVDFTYNKIDKMTGVVTKIDNIQVYVLNDDPAQNVLDAKDYTYGILEVMDRENTDKVVAEIEEEVSQKLNIKTYPAALNLVQALYDGEVQVIIFNTAYNVFVVETEGYEDFPDKVRSIAFKDIETEIEVPEEDDKEVGAGEVFTLYISGVDAPGRPEINSNSDVNILMTVNMETRQILLISTPRDFYVPLSISNGQCDKLTHAGAYGIDVSKDTLGLLYGIEVDGYIKVNFTGFRKIIDALGGITVHSDYSFTQDGFHYNVGENFLYGDAALMFARCRHAFSDGDRQRGRNQMEVISAVINKMASSEMLKNYKEILSEVSECLITSLDYDEISNLAQFQLNDMRGWDVQRYSVNGYDSMNTTYSMGDQLLYVMVPNMETVEQAKQYLKDMYDNKIIKVEEE